jgi:hypothetical protein
VIRLDSDQRKGKAAGGLCLQGGSGQHRARLAHGRSPGPERKNFTQEPWREMAASTTRSTSFMAVIRMLLASFQP